jgi:hypothetical protein
MSGGMFNNGSNKSDESSSCVDDDDVMQQDDSIRQLFGFISEFPPSTAELELNHMHPNNQLPCPRIENNRHLSKKN